MQDVGCRVQDVGCRCRMQGAGRRCWVQDAGFRRWVQGAGCGVRGAGCRCWVRDAGCRCRTQGAGAGCRLTAQPLLMEHPGTLQMAAGAGAAPLPPKRTYEMLLMPNAAEAELGSAADHLSKTNVRTGFFSVFEQLGQIWMFFFLSKGQQKLHASHEACSLPNFNPLVQGVKV